MKATFWMFVISIVFTTTNEQCPLNVDNSPITSCTRSTKYRPFISVDFTKFNRPCNCTVIPSFVGELLVISNGVTIKECTSHIKVTNDFLFGCPTNPFASVYISVQINQPVDVRAEYLSSYTSEPFYHCLGFKQNGVSNGNLSVICGSPSATIASSTTITTTTSTPLSHASTPIEPSIEFTSENTDVTLSSNTINVSHDFLSMESTEDDPEMIYIIAGSAAGGAIILVGLIILILVLINRMRSARNKKGPTEADMTRTNEVFDSNPELPDNPLYLSSQPMDEFGYSSDQEKQLGLPSTDSKTNKKIYSNYDVPPNNKPIDNSASSMPVYAVPKRSKDCTSEVSTVDVYAEVCKPNRSTAHVPVRKRNEEGILYMEVEQDNAATKQTNVNDKNEITEGVCYAEIKRT